MKSATFPLFLVEMLFLIELPCLLANGSKLSVDQSNAFISNVPHQRQQDDSGCEWRTAPSLFFISFAVIILLCAVFVVGLLYGIALGRKQRLDPKSLTLRQYKACGLLLREQELNEFALNQSKLWEKRNGQLTDRLRIIEARERATLQSETPSKLLSNDASSSFSEADQLPACGCPRPKEKSLSKPSAHDRAHA